MSSPARRLSSPILALAGAALAIGVVLSGAAHQPAGAAAIPDEPARRVLSWLTQLPDRGTNRVASGQFGGYSGADFAADRTVAALHAQTGQYPAVLACDYGSGWQLKNDADPRNDHPTTVDHSCNVDLKRWWHDGGLVSVGLHLPNPVDAPGFCRRLATFDQLRDPATPTGQAWRGHLDRVAAGLGDLADAGVPVLFRPFHEMNGDWFWWAGQDPAVFRAVWQDTFRYLTEAKGLRNLLWVYAPDCGMAARTDYYPGADFVHVTGLDCYADDLVAAASAGYRELLALGKPFAFTELGPPDSLAGRYDVRRWAEALRIRFPAAVYYLAWDHIWAPAANLNAPALMADPRVANRADLDLGAVWPAPAPLATFESGAQGWTGYRVLEGPWPVSEWAAAGSGSLKADVDLAAGEVFLQKVGPLDLRGRATLSVAVRTAPWGSPAGGTRAKVYLRTGSRWVWYDTPAVPVDPAGTTIVLDLAGAPELRQVQEIGVAFFPAPGATGRSAVYLDDVRAR